MASSRGFFFATIALCVIPPLTAWCTIGAWCRAPFNVCSALAIIALFYCINTGVGDLFVNASNILAQVLLVSIHLIRQGDLNKSFRVKLSTTVFIFFSLLPTFVALQSLECSFELLLPCIFSALLTPQFMRIWNLFNEVTLAEVEKQLLELYTGEDSCVLTRYGNLGTVVAQDPEDGCHTLVMLHGFGGGNGLWFSVLPHLLPTCKVYFVELYGMGRSERKRWKPRSPCDVRDHFTNELEEWRQAVGLQHFTLLGHSLGAHVAASYACQYSQHVDHLILVSPVGVCHAPSANLPLSPSAEARSLAPLVQMMQQEGSYLRRLLHWVWKSSITPFDVIRALGPILGLKGTTFVWKLKADRSPKTSALRDLRPEEIELVSYYSYLNWIGPASGERSLSTLLMPGAWAYEPMCDWLRLRKEGPEGNYGLSSRTPVSFIYGDHHDWMNSSYGKTLSQYLCNEGGKSEVHCIADAGHLVYLDQPVHFARIVNAALEKRMRS
jgi:pimeloyl-ACP methyl ester carboxylesterase